MPTGANPARGEKHGRAKLSMWDVVAIRALFGPADHPSVSRIAKAFGISRRHVVRLRDGDHWGHI